jgi:DNA repair ATPase RecN
MCSTKRAYLLFDKETGKMEFEKDGFIGDIKDAVENREKVLKKMESLIEEFKGKKELEKKLKELKTSMGYHATEIQNLRPLQSEIKRIYNNVIKDANEKPFTFEDFFFEFERRRKDGKRRIEKFKVGTIVAERVLESVHGTKVE